MSSSLQWTHLIDETTGRNVWTTKFLTWGERECNVLIVRLDHGYHVIGISERMSRVPFQSLQDAKDYVNYVVGVE